MDQTTLFFVIIGSLAFWLLVERLVDRHNHYQQRRKVESAKRLLESHGIRCHLYLPGIGERDPVLYEAMEVVMENGHILTREDGSVVGKIAPDLSGARNSSETLVVGSPVKVSNRTEESS